MAADERKIVIELKALNVAGDDEDDDSGEDEAAAKKRKKAIKSALKKTLSYAYHEISAQVMYDFGNYTTLSENYKAAVLVDNVKTTVNKVKSLAETMISSAMLGAKIGAFWGPVGAGWGAVAGAVVSAGSWVASTGLDLRRQLQQQDISLLMNDKASGYSRSRLGLIDNGRGTYN